MTDVQQIERIPSGVPGLDTVLCGGFPKGGIHIIQGMPGAGKTTLGNQICYHHATTGGNALFVTLLAESHARMLVHLSTMSFFDASRLPEPIFTPSTKAPLGQHDEPMSFAEVEDLVGTDTAARLRDLTLAVYTRGAQTAAATGILVADTKLEFGRDPATGEIVLADEVLTPDSSRFWPADSWEPGRPQASFDKQFVRDWSATLHWDRTPPGPEVPPGIVDATRARYVEAYERITGAHWG